MKIEIGRACDPSSGPPQVGGFGFPIRNQISGNGGPLMIFEMRTNHSHRDKYTPAKR